MKNKNVVILTIILIVLCCLVLTVGGVIAYANSGPRKIASWATPTPTPTMRPATPTATPSLLGTTEKPLVFAADVNLDDDSLNAAMTFVEMLSTSSGTTIELYLPSSDRDLITAMEEGKVHFSHMYPEVYVYANQQGLAEAGMLEHYDGYTAYGIQFLANAEAGFEVYFDPENNKNTAGALTALMQFDGKTPCWGRETSLASYIIPYGYLMDASVNLESPVFLGNTFDVIRGLYNEADCDFGAAYALYDGESTVDARSIVEMIDDFDDVSEKVVVIWQKDQIIPYGVLAFSPDVPMSIREDIMGVLEYAGQDDAWQGIFDDLNYGEFIQVNEEHQKLLEDFTYYLTASGVSLREIIDQ